MNFNFKIKGFEVAVKEDVTMKVEEIEVGYKDVKLSEIPAIIKEVRKTFVELKDIMDSESPKVHHEFHAIVPQSFTAGFPFPSSEETDELFPFGKHAGNNEESEETELEHAK